MRYLFLILGLISCNKQKENIENKLYYKLQNYQDSDFKDVKDSTIVVDLYESIKPYKLQSIKKLNTWNKNNNLTLAYMSIGEAEDYREYYPELNKKLILEVNEQWPGNFTVKYWEPEWQAIIINYVDQIIDQGFNGTYLDIVDCFHRFDDKKLYAKRMAEFIIKIKAHSNKKDKKFEIIIQNGLDIINFLSEEDKNNFLSSISGASLEAHLNEEKKFKADRYYEKLFPIYSNLNKKMYAIEYLSSEDEQAQFFEYAKKWKLIPLVTDPKLRGLDFIHN